MRVFMRLPASDQTVICLDAAGFAVVACRLRVSPISCSGSLRVHVLPFFTLHPKARTL